MVGYKVDRISTSNEVVAVLDDLPHEPVSIPQVALVPFQLVLVQDQSELLLEIHFLRSCISTYRSTRGKFDTLTEKVA